MKESRKKTLREIRDKGQKANWRSHGNLLARYWGRPAAIYGTWCALHLGLTANLITALAAFSWLMEAVCIARGQGIWFEIGVFFGFNGFWLDHVDGQVARVTASESTSGIFLDFWMHTAHGLVRGFALGFGLYSATGDDTYILCGMAAAFGWTMLSLANDAKYKAFFAQLAKTPVQLAVKNAHLQPCKIKTQSGLVKPWRRWLTWPLAKAHEAHVVLLAEAAIALLFHFKPDWAWLLWAYAVRFWAVSSPVLAVARATRMVRTRQVDLEFHDWFRPS